MLTTNQHLRLNNFIQTLKVCIQVIVSLNGSKIQKLYQLVLQTLLSHGIPKRVSQNMKPIVLPAHYNINNILSPEHPRIRQVLHVNEKNSGEYELTSR